jgi:hypothetical protein
MHFELTEAQEEIVRQVRTLCTNYPDDYWRDHEFDRRARPAAAVLDGADA